jgi:eukaryotic-like serine/threonine-protein kinase
MTTQSNDPAKASDRSQPVGGANRRDGDLPRSQDTGPVAAAGGSDTQKSSTPAQSDRNLLFGILAVQMDFISRDALIAAMNAWVLKKSKPLGEILVEQRAVAPDEKSVLDALVDKHLERHHGDPQQSIAVLRLPPTVRQDLEQFADPDVHASLARLPTDREMSLASTATLPPRNHDDKSDERFNVVRRHAWGGLGEVYVAEDLELHREVALKRLHERHANDEDSRTRFLQEAEVTGGLEHPGIVPVYGLGTSADGRPYYAMRFIRGQTLKEAIEHFHADITRSESERRIELRQLLTRFIAVCNAIEYAHSRGVIHRDLKPSNIMLGKYGETLVVDWGLAKALRRRSEDAPGDEHTLIPSSGSGSSETLPGSAIGTPAYMSPEQAEGKIDEIGPASDVYSLGATLYTILTGKEPFDSKHIEIILGNVQAGDFLPPRERNPGIPRALDAICLKAMKLLPRDRYPSSAALANDIEHWLADEPVTAREDPLSDRMIRWIKRHRVLAASSAALTVAAVISLLAGTAVLSDANRQISNAKRLADSNAERAERQGLEAEAARRTAEVEKRNAETEQAKADESAQQARADADRLNWAVYGHEVADIQREWESGDVRRAWLHMSTCPRKLRGWEFDYLHNLLNTNQLTLFGHTENVNSVAFSPDGKRIASGSSDNSVKVWETATGKEILTFKGHADRVWSVAFSPDGGRIASGSADHTVRVWNAATARVLLTFSHQGAGFDSVGFSPDGKWIASSTGDETILWDASTGKASPTPLAGSHPAFSPDGKRLATADSEGGTVRLWDVSGGREVLTLLSHLKFTTSMAFSPDGKSIVGAGYDGSTRLIKLWNAASGKETLTLKAPGVWCVAFSPDSSRIVSGSVGDYSRNYEVNVWDVTQGQQTLSLKGHTAEVNSVAFSPDGKRIASAGADNSVKIWDATRAQAAALNLQAHGELVHDLAWRPDGKWIAGAYLDKTVKVWDVATGQVMINLTGHSNRVERVAYSPDGTRIATGSFDKTVKMWDATTGRELLTYRGHTEPVRKVAFGSDSKRVASFAWDPRVPRNLDDNYVKVWNASNGQDIFSLKGQLNVALSPDGRQLATISADSSIKVWDAWSGRELLTLPIQDPYLWPDPITYSPDGKQIACLAADSIEIWNIMTRQRTRSLAIHDHKELCVAFSPNGSRLAGGFDDGTITVWDTNSGQPTISLKAHTGDVQRLAFSPDGKRLASGAWDHTGIKVWDASREQLPSRSEATPEYADGKWMLARDREAHDRWHRATGYRGSGLWLHRAGGNLTQALEAYRKAVPIMEKLVVDFPADSRYRSDLASLRQQLGSLLEAQGMTTAALNEYRKALTLTLQLVAEFPDSPKYHEDLVKFHQSVALSAMRSGHETNAIAEIEWLTTSSALGATWCNSAYDCACVCAIASGKIARKQKEYADRALEFLDKAVSLGFTDVAHIKKDADLDALRDRVDFKRLLAKLTNAKAKPIEKPSQPEELSVKQSQGKK